MDKYEYNLKLQEINRLVDQQDYEEALRIVDTVDWKRVRNARTLCMISEIYEANGRLHDSKEILLRAYNRSQIGRVVLYRLTEVAIKMKEFDDAVEYYSEFANAAPNDTYRYILKYKIYKGRGSSLEDQISILEEYKEKEYTEQWAYELAKVYQKAGLTQKCIETCDDLVLWFRQGYYVIKSLELKRTLTELSPVQQAIYDNKAESGIEKEDIVESKLPEMEKVILENMPASQEEALTDNIISATERELAQAVTQHTEEIKQEEHNWGFEPGTSLTAAASDTKMLPEPDDELAQEAVSPEALQTEAQPSPFDAENLQEELASSMREIVSGISHRDSEDEIIEPMNDKDFPEAGDEEDPFLTDEEMEGQMSIDDILTSMAGKEKERAMQGLNASGALGAAVSAAAAMRAAAAVATNSNTAAANAIGRAIPDEQQNTSKEKPNEDPPAKEKIMEKTVVEESLETVPDATIDLSSVVEAAAGVADLKPMDSGKSVEFAEAKRKQMKRNENMQQPQLTPDQQYIFSYFSTIRGLREHVAVALKNAVQKIRENKTSKSGNIVITGLPGSGRTALGVCFAKCISKEKGQKAAKIAKIYAEDFNKKDIPATIAKISGGVLIIEEAGDLEEAVVKQLSKAMEFRTDGLIIILEDEKKLLKPLFEQHPEFAEKFTSEVNVPIFTNDELVSFGKTYAFDEDYKIDDMATLALYNSIGDLQSPEQPVTVADVKDIVDRAIKRSERIGFRKLGKILSRKRYDEDDRIILYEKDFK